MTATVQNNEILDQAFKPGDTAWFECHCLESYESSDAELWYRTHQKVTVLSLTPGDGIGLTLQERVECGQPFTYVVRFEDGHEGDAWEDELSTSKDSWYRPDPPTPRT